MGQSQRYIDEYFRKQYGKESNSLLFVLGAETKGSWWDRYIYTKDLHHLTRSIIKLSQPN